MWCVYVVCVCVCVCVCNWQQRSGKRLWLSVWSDFHVHPSPRESGLCSSQIGCLGPWKTVKCYCILKFLTCHQKHAAFVSMHSGSGLCDPISSAIKQNTSKVLRVSKGFKYHGAMAKTCGCDPIKDFDKFAKPLVSRVKCQLWWFSTITFNNHQCALAFTNK